MHKTLLICLNSHTYYSISIKKLRQLEQQLLVFDFGLEYKSILTVNVPKGNSYLLEYWKSVFTSCI